jgi:hypothetical protein
MMSKERESLKRLVAEMNLLPERQGLDPIVCETKELLAQHEQEPVAWRWEDNRNETNSWATVCCPRKPDNSAHVKNVVPLYTSPPKREPLSDTKCPCHKVGEKE